MKVAAEFTNAAGTVSHNGIKKVGIHELNYHFEGCIKNMRVNSYCILILMYMETLILMNLVS